MLTPFIIFIVGLNQKLVYQNKIIKEIWTEIVLKKNWSTASILYCLGFNAPHINCIFSFQTGTKLLLFFFFIFFLICLLFCVVLYYIERLNISLCSIWPWCMERTNIGGDCCLIQFNLLYWIKYCWIHIKWRSLWCFP